MQIRHSRIPVLSLAFLMLAAMLAGGCATDKSVIAQAQTTHQALEPAVITDPQIATYIQTVGDRIVDTAREMHRNGYEPGKGGDWMFSDDMKFHVVNSSTINAFTTGGEHMYIYSALIEQCADEDELAAVMAHEYAHVFGRHVQASTDRQTAIGLGAAGAGYIGQEVGGDSGSTYSTAFTTAVALGGQFLGMGYTRAQEDEADKFGFAFYTHAGWDPQQFAGFFKKMIQAGADSTPALLSDHPTLASRVEATNRRISELPKNASQWRRPPVKNPQEFAQFKQRVKQVGANMPDDKSLEEAQTLLAAFASCISPAREPSREKARAEIAESVEQQKAAPTR